MAEKWAVAELLEGRDSQGVENWQVFYERPNGERFVHVFPKDTLAYRAAEYGIDPADVDTLLDIVLHEPYIPDPTDPVNHASDAAARKGMTVADGAPAWLYNAPSVDVARVAHRERVATTKRERVEIASGLDKLAPIRARVDTALVAKHRVRVAASRRRLLGEKGTRA